MGKLVILKIGHGSFEVGFPVTLQIGEDGDRPSTEIAGMLPPAPDIPQRYSCWAEAYRGLGLRSRKLEAKPGVATNVSKIEECCNTAELLRDRLNVWLGSESFRSIREKLLEQLMPCEEVRAIVQTEDIRLRRLPWHLWDVCDRYPKAEIALSGLNCGRVQVPTSTKVRILAILGNSAGIDTQTDRILLEQLPDSEITFIVEPQREQLTETLWKQGWDILFFAGHSSSGENGETGRIYINQTDSLTIDELKFALKKAVERGLKIAIFNSCDGLGLASDSARLQIPQTIVMREPVPDRVAQEFLKNFLEAFSSGESFYLAVREARERLQGLEAQFPCATWLPIICQDLTEVPPTWQELCGIALPTPDAPPVMPPTPLPAISPKCRLGFVFLASVAVTFFCMGTRRAGMLQPLELRAFDHLMQQRSDEKPDKRLLLVTVTEKDLQLPEQKEKKGSLSDLALDRLLQKLEPHKPQVIGLDIYRDYRADAKYPALATRMEKSDRLIAVCKVSNPEEDSDGVLPPPEVPTKRLGFTDFVHDRDGIIRRHLLALKPPAASQCKAPYAFSVQLAFRYLAAKGILPKFTQDEFLQLGSVVFKPLEPHTGGYQGVNAGGYQVLLNYRSGRSPKNIVEQVTLAQVLNDRVGSDFIKDRIVIIGTTANSFGDYWRTPYSNGEWFDRQMPGAIVQAQMVSQILSAVLDGRSMLWVWPLWGETLWVWIWSLIGGMLVWSMRSRLHLSLAIAAALGSLYGICFVLLVFNSCWAPLVPPSLALIATGPSVAAYTKFQVRRRQQSISKLSHEFDKFTSQAPLIASQRDRADRR